MKVFVFLFVAFFCAQSFAFTLTHVNGASNEIILDGKKSPVFMAGISGSQRCLGQTTTVDTCSTNPERAACNYKTVCPTSHLQMTFTAKISGKVALMDVSNFPLYQLGNYTAGTTHTVNIPWSEICYGISSDRTCQVIARSVLRIAVSDGQKQDGANYIFQTSRINDTLWNIKTDKMESLSYSKYGIADYSIAAGNGHAILKNLKILDLYLGEAARVTGIRAYYAPTSCAKIQAVPTAVNTSDESDLFFFNGNQTEITQNMIEGLQNGVKYAFMLGVQDEAGNVGMFKDLSTQCAEGQHTATPKAL